MEDDLLYGGPCPVVRLAPHKLLCLLILLLGLNFLPQPLQANTLPLCCQILCWLGICKDLKALSQTLQGWTISLSCALSPHTGPIQRQHDFPHKPALNTCRSSGQQMSTPSHVPLKADSGLENDVADDKADLLVWLQLNQISVLQYFLKTACSMDHNMCLESLFSLRIYFHSGCTVPANREGWQVAGDLVPKEAADIHDFGSLCISTM